MTWDGTTLASANGVAFTLPQALPGADALGEAPAGGYDLTEVRPAEGIGLHVLVVDGTTGLRYSLWFPPNQALGQPGAPLVFDWKLANSAVLAAAIPTSPFPEALEGVGLVGNFFVGGADVAGTNLMVTVGLLMLLLVGGTLFNEALEENAGSVRVGSVRLPGVLGGTFDVLARAWAAVAATWAAIAPGKTWLDRAAGPAGLLLGTGLIYSLLEPGFGRNEQSFTIFVSLVVSQGVLVLMYEGGKAWLYRRRLRVQTGLKLFPACILIALVSVAISRAAGFQPGIVIGFVASVVFLGDREFDPRDRGRALATVAAAMLTVSVAAWLAAVPLHELYEASPSVWTALPEATALSIFVVCLQGLLFSLIPLEFVDGWRIWKWNPFAWLALFVPSAFLFTQILFNEQDAYLDLIASQKSIIGFGVLVAYIGFTFGTWAYFRWRAERQSSEPLATTET